MKRVFHDFGAMIVTVIAVVALIGLTVFLMRPGSVMANAFSAITGQFVDAADEMIGGAGTGEDSEDVAATPYNQVYVAEVGGSLWEARLIEVDGALIAYLIVDDALDGELPVAIEGQNMMANGEVVGTFTEDFKSVTLSEDFGGVTLSGELAMIAMGKVYGTCIYADGGYITVQYVFYEDGSVSFSYSFGDETDAGTAPAGSAKYDNGIIWAFDDESGDYVFTEFFALSDERLYLGGIVLEPGGEIGGTTGSGGLYDADGNLVASWDVLTTVYGMDVTHDYAEENEFFDNTASPYNVLTNNSELSAGVKLVIPDGVTTIGDSAFVMCSSLTSIEIPDSVTGIGAYAFSWCTGLTSVVIPEGVTTIADGTFGLCTGLLSVELPASVTIIGDEAFRGCKSLTNVTFGENSQLNSIGYQAFQYCDIVNIEIPASVTGIAEQAFYCCDSLVSVTFGENSKLTSIGRSAFHGCTNLTSIKIPASVTSLGSEGYGGEVFSGCTSLASIEVCAGNSVYHSNGNCIIETATKTLIAGCKNSVIPDDGSVTSICERAFYQCESLESIEIPDSVTTIKYMAFGFCEGLTSVKIPASVTIIGQVAFTGCTSLSTITFDGTTTQWNAISFGTSWNSDVPATQVVCSNGTVTLS